MERLVLPDVPASVWDDFHAGRSVDVEPKFQELERCWSRARLLGAPAAGAPPEEGLLRGDALREHIDRLELIRAVGETLIDRATARVADHDFLLLLADPDGVVVRTSGGGDFAAIAQDVRLIEGASWSEAARGTNAIGTAAAANLPTEVHGHAHFGRSYHQLVCYAAPIRGLDGEPLAVLDATSRIECADPKVARIVLETARALEEVVRMHGYASAGLSMTRALRRSLDHMRGPAFLIESPGRIARANAAAADLGIDSLHKLGISWKDVAREGLTPTHGGLPIMLHSRAWRLTADPIATPAGDIMAALVVLAPGRVSIAAPTRRVAPDPFQKIFSETSR